MPPSYIKLIGDGMDWSDPESKFSERDVRIWTLKRFALEMYEKEGAWDYEIDRRLTEIAMRLWAPSYSTLRNYVKTAMVLAYAEYQQKGPDPRVRAKYRMSEKFREEKELGDS